MASVDIHLRHLIECARDKQSHRIVDDAFSIIEGHHDRFNAEFSPELLVLFAEVASDLRGREPAVIRALELHERLRCGDDQFKARALLVRCVYEARLGEACRLKGQHLLQQLRYALTFLTAALSVAGRPGNDARYGFLACNASRVFWEVARPACRLGWQRHVVREAEAVLAALRAAQGPAAGAKAAGGAGAGAPLPAPVGAAWLLELSLHLAFGHEDAGDAAAAQRAADSAAALLEELQRERGAGDAQCARLRELVWNARAHFARKQPEKTRQEINAASGGAMAATALFVGNGGVAPERCEEELMSAWAGVDGDFDIREAAKGGGGSGGRPEAGARKSLSPQKLIELAAGARAACTAGCYSLAQVMLARLDSFPVPAGRGRILLDLSRAELDVWRACKSEHEDPVSGMLLGPRERGLLEAEARQRAVRLCEQCIMAARRLDDVSLVEESAVVLWNLGKELLAGRERLRVHKSLQKCADILEEVQSVRLARLRVQLHLEVAFCEVAQDLLTKGVEELQRAHAIDYTAPESDLREATQKYLSERSVDPAKHIRRFDEVIDQQHHLLRLKLSLYEEPDDPADQVMLLLDQVQRQKSGGVSDDKLTFNMLTQGFAKLEAALDEVLCERLELRSNTVEKRPLVVSSSAALLPLPNQAPAAVKEGGPSEAEVSAIRDQKQKSDREAAVEKAKRLVTMMCKIGLEASRVGQPEFAIRACSRAIGAVVGGAIPAAPPRCRAAGDVSFGPPPIEVEGALLLAEAAYAKAQCLAALDPGAVSGLDDELAELAEAGAPEAGPAGPAGAGAGAGAAELGAGRVERQPAAGAEERAARAGRKRELIRALLFGMELSCDFEQWWMVANGLAHWWNLHVALVELGARRPQVLAQQALQEYHSGLREIQGYFYGERRLPNADFRHALVANLALAHIDASVLAGQLGVLEADQLMVMRRLAPDERRELAGRVTELCRAHDRPIPDLARLRPERLDGQLPPAAPGKAAPAKGAPPPPPPALDDKADLQGYEADVAMYTASVSWAKDLGEAQRSCVDKAVELLNRWEPRENDEAMLTLWVKLWTALGRKCLQKPMNTNVGAKYALMCGIKGLGAVDTPIPKHASPERLRWRGACHALCGQAFHALVDPHRQEKDSLESLRRTALAQFEKCCDYALETSHKALAVSGATSLWQVALPLLHSAETRKVLIEPLHKASQALAKVHYRDDVDFIVDIYASLFDCYSDLSQWDNIHEMLNDAFRVVPSNEPQSQRRLWALRMLALSRQGKDVAVAMGKMKETQARAQARIWMVLAHASSKPLDQLNAYSRAIEILQGARQPDVVEVRIQFADWLLRNAFGVSDAQDELSAAADLLLEVEEESDNNDEEAEASCSEGDGSGSSGAAEDRDQSDLRSRQSRRGRGRGGCPSSEPGSPERKHAGRHHGADGRSKASSRASGQRPAASFKRSAVSSKSNKSSRSKGKPANLDEQLPSELSARNYDSLCRIYAAKGKLGLGRGSHDALLAAAHFAVRFFASLVGGVNSFVQQAAEGEARAEGAGREAGPPGPPGAAAEAGPGGPGAGGAGAGARPPFAAPARLADWAWERAWPWRGGAFGELLGRARGEAPGEAPAGAAAEGAGAGGDFEDRALAFHSLARLQADLEEHGYQLWALPVLALLLHLGQACADEPALRDAVCCLGHLRLGRFAAECGLAAAAHAARAAGGEELERVRGAFGSFEEELERARNQRLGRGAAGALDPDWLDSPKPGVGAPWLCSRLHAYEVWAELGKECLLHGEMWMACKLVAEATRHAQEHGDRRTLRVLLVIQARIACIEGRPLEAIRILGQVSAAEMQQAADVAILLAEAYRRVQQQVFAEDVLKDALQAVTAVTPSAPDGAARNHTNEHILAQCMLQTAQVHAMLAQLSSTAVASSEWMARLDSALALHSEIGGLLQTGALHRRRLATCVDIMDVVLGLIEDKRVELVRRCEGDGALSLERLAGYAREASLAIARCRPSRDELLSTAVSAEEAVEGLVAPGEVLAARLDVREASAAALQRALASALEERRRAPGPAAGPAGRERVREWLEEVEGQIAEVERVRGAAREVAEVEASVALLSHAAAALAPPAAAGAAGPAGPAACAAEALVELGRLQLELAARRAPGPARWAGGAAADACEARGMETAERCSNALQARDPGQAFQVPEEAAGRPRDVLAPAEGDPAEVPYERVAKATLCDAVAAALDVRHFAAARRGLQVLALEAYGSLSAEASFEFLALLQSTNVCMKAEGVLAELLPEDHHERVQMHLLRALERFWSDPRPLGAYQSTAKRLQLESPFFQRLLLNKLPAVSSLLLAYLPPLTLVVTLQLHEHNLYVGAVCSPPEGDSGQRMTQLRHFVMRRKVSELELQRSLHQLQELNTEIEKELIAAPELNSSLAEKYSAVLSHVDALLVEPIAQELAGHFWLHGLPLEHPNNPRQVLLLPDITLWDLPLERLPSFLSLLGRSHQSAISRDLSLHVAAQRVQRFVEASSEGELSMLKTPLLAAKPSTTVLLTDPFNEDVLPATDGPKFETMCALHERLLRDRVIGNEEQSLCGKAHVASPEDVKGMLADCSAFYSLGFCQFFTAISAGRFASQDLRHVALLALFHRAINDSSFRRQTKTNSTRTSQELAVENSFGLSLVAAFRGVLCALLAVAPVPVALALRCLEAFARELREGRTAAGALERLLGQTTASEELRFARPREGEAPPARDAKAARGEEEPQLELLPPHARAAYLLVGAPWLAAEAAEAGRKR